MPLFLQHTEPAYRWGIWKTTETEDELGAVLPSLSLYQQALQRLTAEHRRREWLAVRVLLFTLLGEEREITYLPSGKPCVERASISISHTRGYVAVILGQAGEEVGIDIEQYGERVHKVAPKYMRADEVPSSYQGTDTWSLLLHWSAKETMFKCMNASEVDFREHLRIFPFTVSEKGTFEAEEYRTSESQHFQLHYLIQPDFVMTWQAD